MFYEYAISYRGSIMIKRLLIGVSIFMALGIGAFAGRSFWTGEAAQALLPDQAQPSTVTAEGVLVKTLSHGIYQILYNPQDQLLYAAAAEMSPGVRGGVIYQMDPMTLDVKGVMHTDEKNFGLALNAQGNALFISNSLASSVSRIALGGADGSMRRTHFTDKSSDGSNMGARTVIHDAAQNRIYVGGVGNPSVIWVLDASTLELIDTIRQTGKWMTGLLIDTDTQRLFAGNGDGEILVIDLHSHRIVARWKPAGDEEALPLNFALDKQRRRLYVTENQHAKTVFVLDADTGKVIRRLPVGDTLDALYNPERNELYLTHREQGKVSVLDGETYAIKAQYALPTHPNSLALGPKGQLYVSVKEPFRPFVSEQDPLKPRYYASAREKVARIDLDRQPR
jgi:DNA-binding beta-propeller fold protein YncE